MGVSLRPYMELRNTLSGGVLEYLSLDLKLTTDLKL